MDLRHSQYVLVDKKVQAANNKLQETIDKLGWTRQELQAWQKEQASLQTCPFNKRHLVPFKSMKEHYRQCLLKSRNNAKKQKKPIPSSLFFYKQAPSVISFTNTPSHTQHKNKIDTSLLHSEQEHYVKELEPLKSVTEKCQAYDQVIQRSKALVEEKKTSFANSAIDFIVHDKQKKAKKELLGQQQQMNKWKRPKYRVKLKATTPTQTQKELIDAYMQEHNTNIII